MRRLVPILLLTACGSSSKGSADAQPVVPDGPIVLDAATADAVPVIDATPADAPPPDFSCVGAGPATSAPNPVTLKGIVHDGASSTPLQMVNLDFLMPDETTVIGSTQTLANGRFTLALPTGGNPLPGVGRLSLTSYVDFWLYPAEPLYRDLLRIPAVMLTPGELQLAALFDFNGATYDDTKGVVVVQVVDCANRPLAGATVTITPASGIGLYGDDSGTPSSSQLTTSTVGLYEILNVDPTATFSASGTVGTAPVIQLHGAAAVPVHAGQMTATIIHP
jgi:hypothetical protein